MKITGKVIRKWCDQKLWDVSVQADLLLSVWRGCGNCFIRAFAGQVLP